jgi:hypothetical protein
MSRSLLATFNGTLIGDAASHKQAAASHCLDACDTDHDNDDKDMSPERVQRKLR